MPERIFNFTSLVLKVGFEKSVVMDFEEQQASCVKARQLDMVAYLAGLGYEPVKI